MQEPNVHASLRAQFEHVPPELRAARQWLAYRIEPHADPTKKPRKVPYYVTGGRREGTLDTPEDMARLVTFDEALDAWQRLGPAVYSGLAVALNNGWQGIDFDDVPQNQLADLANEVPGYVEKSPSGNGCHALGYGAPFASLGSNGTGIEAYAAGRFFTVTGNTIRPGPLADLAPFVQQRLVPRHGAARGPAGAGYEVETLAPQTITELRSALNAIPCDDRQVWVSVGMALKTLGESVGWELWATWSQRSTKWDAQEAGRTWDGLTPTRTGYAAIFSRAQAHGWVNPASNAAQVATPAAQGQWVNGDYWPTAAPRPPDALVMRTADTVAMQSIEWLWPGYIACEFLNLIVGETSAGKSTVLADVAARVTTGRPWPGEPPQTALRWPGRVLWLGSEDPMELLTVPRLRACGAELQRVTEVQGVTRGGQRGTFSLQDDLSAVRAELGRARGEGQPYAMLVIDPITSYLHGGKLRRVDMNDSGHLRTVLEPWVVLAAETGIAIVGVTHLAKDTTRSLLHRVLGGGAFAQLCRSLIAVVNRPDEGPYEKAILQVKSNLPDAQKGAWRFRTAQRVVGVSARGREVQANFPEWDRFDAALTPEALAGGARGPVSKYPAVFGLWLQTYFATLPPDFVPVADVRARALADGVVSDKWWNEHSAEYLDKRNVNGLWLCRPRVPAV
ncbi:MAG: AAA family ATPase [Rubrivivax sp.]|nr:AAA family ATPase [Rubrivivax sp.]